MKKIFLFYLLSAIFLILFSCNSQNNSDEMEIDKALETQAIAWNEGNIEKFMNYYWKSDSLKFISKNGVTQGWTATLERYKKNYPDKEAMGFLSFQILSKQPIGKNYFVIGKWHLQREKDELGGYFSLLWRKINGQWVIVVDHTS